MNSIQLKRIYRELMILQKDIMSECLVEPHNESELIEWRVYLYGPCGTPYENGKFQLRVTFQPTYPFTPPDIQFVTQIFHPNIGARGEISMNHPDSYIPTAATVCRFLDDLRSIPFRPATDYFLNSEAGFLFDHDRKEFQRLAFDWTMKYAVDAGIISRRSLLPTASAIISPADSSPNSHCAHSPSPGLWIRRLISFSIETSTEQERSYSKEEQLALERAYQSDISMSEVSEKLIHFGQGIQVCEERRVWQVERNIPKLKRFRRRHQSLAFFNPQSDVPDPIITDCLDCSVDTSLSALTSGIRREDSLIGQELQAEQLAKDLEKIDGMDPVLIGLECIRLYTKNSFLYKVVNQFLRQRDRSKITTLGPFCKVLYSQFDKYRTNIDSLKVYRGENLRSHELRAYKRATGKGSYQFRGFTSTSKDKTLAEIYIRNALFIIRLEKRYNDGRAFDISKLSQFKEEDEVLLRPAVEFSIDNYKYDENSKIYTFHFIANI